VGIFFILDSPFGVEAAEFISLYFRDALGEGLEGRFFCLSCCISISIVYIIWVVDNRPKTAIIVCLSKKTETAKNTENRFIIMSVALNRQNGDDRFVLIRTSAQRSTWLKKTDYLIKAKILGA
jgi:hypothetical protein